jgi:hypothetical protein
MLCCVAVCFPLAAVAADTPLKTPGAGAIHVAEEFLLLEDGPGKGVQGTPHVAFGKAMYLVVWREGWHGKGGSARVFAARVSAGGRVLDPQGIEVAPCRDGVQERPRVAFGGGVFLVVWQDFRNGKDYDVLAARISPEGKVLGKGDSHLLPERPAGCFAQKVAVTFSPIPVAVAPRTQVLPEAASDGERFLVVWQGLQGEETSYRGFAASIDAEGRVGATVETGAAPQPKIAWNGKCYLVGYGSTTVSTLMLDRQGRPLGRTPRGNPALSSTKAAVFSLSAVPGRGWLIVGHRSPPDPWGWGGPGAMRAALLNSDGQLENQDAVKEPAGVQQRLPGWLDLGREKRPGATWPWGESASAWTGTHSLVVWQRQHLCGEKMTNFENCDLIAARLDGFRSLDQPGLPMAVSDAEERRPALASDGAGHLLCVYEKHQDGTSRIAARMLTER